MSRVGKKPIPIPKGVQVTLSGGSIKLKGPLGELERSFHPDITIRQEDNSLLVERPSDDPFHRALHGLTRSLLYNMILGVTKGFEKELEIQGIGYRVQQMGEKLTFQLGFSHPLEFVAFPGIRFQVEGANRIKVLGIDKEKVGETAAQIRRLRLPNPYSGKGIRYVGEIVRRKAGKAAVKKA